MKNFSVFVNGTGENSENHNHTILAYGHRQGRTYGPLLHFLLATFLTKVAAKYVASTLLPLSQRPWFSNKPVNYLSFNQYQHSDPAWKPASPYLHGLTAFASESYHDHYSPPDPSKIEEYHTATELNTESFYHHEDTNVESSDQIPSQSQYNYRRQLPQRWSSPPKRNFPPKWNNRFSYEQRIRNPSNRFGTTTPYYDYYDNYDDSINRRPPYRTRRPFNRRRPSTENYDYLYDSAEYDDYSYEDYLDRTTKRYDRTTKPSRKRRKPTKKTKNRARDSEEDLESDESVEELDEVTEGKKVVKEPQQRQQATTTTESTTTDSTESTTEASTTTTQATTSTASPNVTQSTGYGPGGNYGHISFTYGPPVLNPNYSPPFHGHSNGYGPSNGNERISITEAPSTFPIFYHNFPYNNLFPQELTKNAIVQKVHDIVGFEHDFVHKK